MLVYLDGPEKAGKSTLVAEILKGFWTDRSSLTKWNGRDEQDGLGYMNQFLTHIDSPNVNVWDRGWLSEAVYGELLSQGRAFASDQFLMEWFYGRPLLGRGGRFVVLPSRWENLIDLRDETDLPVEPEDEFKEYAWLAKTYDYEVLTNDYEAITLANNTVKARRSAVLGLHGITSHDYIGPLNPRVTFITDRSQWFPTNTLRALPFYDQMAAELFRPFGNEALFRFGYASLDGYLRWKDLKPELFKGILTVSTNDHLLDKVWNIQMGWTKKWHTDHQKVVFVGRVREALKEGLYVAKN